jgi:hypothetical protein
MAIRESASQIQTGLTPRRIRRLSCGLPCVNPSNQMRILIINTHLTYAGWSESKLNLAFMDLAKAFFLERGLQLAEAFVERGYKPEAEVKKHAGVRTGHPPDAGELVRCTWIYKKYMEEVFNAGLTTKVLLEGDGRTPAGSMVRHLKNTVCELISQRKPA